MRVEVSFQIDEEDLVTGLQDLRNALDQNDALSAFVEAYRLLNAVGEAHRFEVDPNDKDDSE